MGQVGGDILLVDDELDADGTVSLRRCEDGERQVTDIDLQYLLTSCPRTLEKPGNWRYE